MVSIIIPVYNGEDFIEEAVRSSMIQGDCVSEIILIDDHSTDETRSIIESLAKANPGLISVHTNTSKGTQSARNLGIRLSTSEYLQFLDADDILSPNKISSQLELLKTGPENAVASCTWLHFVGDISNTKPRKQIIDKSYSNPIDWLIDSWTGGGMGQTGIWLVPRRVIDLAGWFDENLKKNQDGDYFARVLMNCSSILYSEEATVFYRKPQEGNVSYRENWDAARSVLQSYKNYEVILSSKDSKRIRKALFMNYQRFIYSYYNSHRDLASKAIAYAKELGFTRFNWSHNHRFSLMSRLLGYKTAFFLRNTVRGY